MALIYILEDDKDICEIESLTLKTAGYDTKMFYTVKGFFDELLTQVPDLAIIDVELPDGDGYNVVSKIRDTDSFCRLPIVMVTGKITEFELIRGIETGADDYIKKPFSVMEYLTRIKSVLRRAGYCTKTKGICRVGGIVLDDARHKVFVDNEEVDLTCIEFKMLRLLMINQGIVVEREEFLSKVWGMYCNDESRKIDVHMKSLRKKMKGEGEHIKTIRNVGFVIA